MIKVGTISEHGSRMAQGPIAVHGFSGKLLAFYLLFRPTGILQGFKGRGSSSAICSSPLMTELFLYRTRQRIIRLFQMDTTLVYPFLVIHLWKTHLTMTSRA
jgi:hypothetical protein